MGLMQKFLGLMGLKNQIGGWYSRIFIYGTHEDSLQIEAS